MAKKEMITDVRIKLVVEYPEEMEFEDMIDTISAELDYNVSYDDGKIKIIETEIVEVG